MTEGNAPLLGAPQDELPTPGRTSATSQYWKNVRKELERNPGKWVPMKLPGKTDPYGTASNVTSGRNVTMNGIEAAVRDKVLYLRAPNPRHR